jgi:hypothetical protein
MTLAMVDALGEVQSLERLADAKTVSTSAESIPNDLQMEMMAGSSNGPGEAEKPVIISESQVKDVHAFEKEPDTAATTTSKSRTEVNSDGVAGSETDAWKENGEPTLSNPKIGNPISHGQVIDLWKKLTAGSSPARALDSLLQGTRVYIPPPQPKAEPVRPQLFPTTRL